MTTLTENSHLEGLRWVGNAYVAEAVCQVCYQSECLFSTDAMRPQPGAMPSRLERGQREYRGYSEWAVHPDEASFILHRGYAIVDGRRVMVAFIHNEAYVTQLRIDGSDVAYALEAKFWGPAAATAKESVSV